MRGHFLTATISLSVLAGIAAPATAGMITTADDNGADALIRHGSFSDANFGHFSTIAVKNDGPTAGPPGIHTNRKSYIRFDVSSISGLVSDVALILTANSTDTGSPFDVNIYGLLDGHAGENWDESLITWNNAPANDIPSWVNVTSDAVYLGTLSVPLVTVGTQLTFSSTALTDFINADSNGIVTLIFTPVVTDEDPVNFASKEHSTLAPPTLSFTESGATVPEPTSLALLGSGAIGILALRRRRQHSVAR